MHGSGTRLEHTADKAPPPARLLDLTRLVSRAGRRPTGVDRVELAYLRALLTQAPPLFGIMRTTLGFVLLDRGGCAALAARLEGSAGWGDADLLSRLARRKPLPVRRAESDLRRLARARCRPRGLGRMLNRCLPHGAAYLNVGHSNLTGRMLDAAAALGGVVTVMIHDTIPLDFPQYQRDGTPERFGAMLRRVAARADVILCNSAHTRDRLCHRVRPRGRVVVAHLGLDPVTPDAALLPPDLPENRPYFVALGTIEPRKRHDLLLDVWDDMAADRAPGDLPALLICGARGWRNEAVFARLDALDPFGPVRELGTLPDAAVAALLQGARALLFPSEAEGYGLPPLEATALGTTVVCQDLPIYRELLGTIPVYLGETNRYQWRNTVESLERDGAGENRASPGRKFTPPRWRDHFKTVLSFT